MTGRQHRYGIGLCCRADTSKSMQHQPPHPGGITVQAAVQPAPPVVAHMIADFLGIQLTPKTNRRQRAAAENAQAVGKRERQRVVAGSANTQRRVSNFSVSGARGLANSPTS